MRWIITALKGYATFSGRSRRMEYWMFVLFYTVTNIALSFVDYAVGMYDPDTGWGILGAVFTFLMIAPYLAVSARRLHDTDKSGWRQLVFLIPFIGFIFWVIWMATEGDAVPNKFGPDPKLPNSATPA